VNFASPQPRRRVVILQRVMPHYRLAFFRRLHEELAARGIGLAVLYGDERPGTIPKTVPLEEPWARRIRNRYLAIGRRELIWQPALRELRQSDLVILEQSSRLLLNYRLMMRGRRNRPKIAYWGHGENFQAAPGFLERMHQRWKGAATRRADWFFAYSDRTLEPLRQAGFPPERVTVVDNSIDSTRLRAARDALTLGALEKLRDELGLEGGTVALYCGAIYREKRIGFLIEACEEVRRRVPDFRMIFVGAGPDQHLVEAAAARHDWIRYVGPKFATEAVPYFALSKAFLLPCGLGLAINDALALGVPIFTTTLPGHGPEIAYLEPGRNGEMTDPDPQTYADAVARYLLSSARQARYADACRATAAHLTVEAMAERFAEGIAICLGDGRPAGSHPTVASPKG
jgi:glycosyltransferase involved in cell wall biosynthesis